MTRLPRTVVIAAIVGFLGLGPERARPDDSTPAAAPVPGASGVAAIQDRHDRELLRDLTAYVVANPQSDDAEQGYAAIFDVVIRHDWFADHESVARKYLADRPDGPVRSLARIVSAMARAQQGDFSQALLKFRELMTGLGKPEQEEFASNFTDALAMAAIEAGEYPVARQVYQALVDRYGESTAVVQKVQANLRRLDVVGKPAPEVSVRDLAGETLRLEDLRGKYVLVDFWATWCAPCVAEMPRLKAAHARYKGKGLEIVGVSLDETKGAVTDFVKARALDWKQVLNAGNTSDMVEAFGVSEIPASFLIDPTGRIVRLDLRGPALDRVLGSLIGKPADAPAAKP